MLVFVKDMCQGYVCQKHLLEIVTVGSFLMLTSTGVLAIEMGIEASKDRGQFSGGK